MTEHDTLQRFIFENTNVRGEIVRLRASYQAVSERHDYPLPIKQWLGETLAATTLLGATIKFEGSLILQMQSDGVLRLLVAQSTHEHHIRGLAQWEGAMLEGSLKPMGEGRLAITIIPNQGERYQGVVEIIGNSLASSIENYFAQSEQIPTCLILAADENVAAGLLLQSMPDVKTDHKQNFWEHVLQLTRTLSSKELLELPNQEILKRLFHQEDVRLFETTPVSFRCDCNIDRMERAILVFGYEQTMEIFSSHKDVTVTCEFCNRRFDFDKVDIERIFASGSYFSSDAKH